MTFAEKLREMYPERSAQEIDEIIAQFCPEEMGLEEEMPDLCPCLSGEGVGDLSPCFRCWERIMPGKEGV